MTDILLESVRAVIILGVILYLWKMGRNRFELSRRGWNFILGGFTLLLFGSLLDVTDNFETLSRFVLIGDTRTQAVLEKLVGYLGGFLLIAIGLARWIPTVQQLSDELGEKLSAEQALRDSESKVRVLLNSTAEAIYAVDTDGDCTFANPACARLLGYDHPSEFIGVNMHRLIHHTTVDGRPLDEKACRINQAFRKEEDCHVDDEVLWRADGKSFPAEYWSHQIREGGELVGAVVTFLDITDRRQAEAAQLAATRDAERATAMKSRFLAAASHDLRQPLQAVTLLTAALARKISGAENLRLLERQAAVHVNMSELLNALLDVSKLEDAPHFEIGDLRMADVFERMSVQFTDAAQAAGLDLRIVSSSAVVRSSEVLLDHIVQNLLTNGIENTETGKILLGCRRRGSNLRIEVWDTGSGIPDDELSAIFEDFYQLGNPERDLDKGLGLGLSIVERSARLLGHKLEVRSQPGKGSMFSVLVPLSSLTDIPRSSDAPVKKTVTEHPSALITLVDDNPQVLDSTRILLECEGYDLIPLRGGDDVLSDAMSRAVQSDLIIADWRLPGGENGVDVVKRIREVADRKIPAILVTGDTSPEPAEQAEAEDCRVLYKPVKPDDLIETIGRLLS